MRISIKAVEPLELEYSDGTIKRAWFTNESMIKLSSMYGDISELLEDGKNNPWDACSKILYCALSVEDPAITLEEAKSILISGGNKLISEIYEAISENFGVDEEEIKKKVQEMTSQ